MPNENASLITHWTVTVSNETDISVRTFLAQRGMKKGDLSKFIETSVKWYLAEQVAAKPKMNAPTSSSHARNGLPKGKTVSVKSIISSRLQQNVLS